jgi:predicted nucleotidyltransferase
MMIMAGSIQKKRHKKLRSPKEIMQILKQAQPDISKRYKVKSLGVFGSYIRGEAKKNSDLDILVELEDRSLTLLQFIALENYLSDLLGVKVDLVEKSALKPVIGRHILEEVQPV